MQGLAKKEQHISWLVQTSKKMVEKFYDRIPIDEKTQIDGLAVEFYGRVCCNKEGAIKTRTIFDINKPEHNF